MKINTTHPPYDKYDKPTLHGTHFTKINTIHPPCDKYYKPTLPEPTLTGTHFMQ